MNTKLNVTRISNREQASVIIAENDSHRVRFLYFDNYEDAFKNNCINPDDLAIQVKPKAAIGGFGINFVTQSRLTHQCISILGSDLDYCGEEMLLTIAENATATYETIQEIKRLLREYFPGVYIEDEQN